MPIRLNETHDAGATSWVDGANDPGTEFPIQNLPFGVFRRGASGARVGVAIGDRIFDVAAAADAGLLGGAVAHAAEACRAPVLNRLLALGPAQWSILRSALARLLRRDNSEARKHADAILVRQRDAEMVLPVDIGDYTDFFAARAHAENAGKIMGRPEPLLPNYRYVPVAYHSRSSSVVVSGTPVVRPSGQFMTKGAAVPSFGASRRLDYELEVGAVIGPGNNLGAPISLAEAESHVFGLCLLNDWSARDIQAWEGQPLGPFLAKSFTSTISPWIVTLEALAPFRTERAARPAGDPEPLPHLDAPDDRRFGAIDLAVEAWIETEAMRKAGAGPSRVSRARFRDMYWTFFQMVAHHTSNGCNLRPGDLLGSGTVSGVERESAGCLLERSWGGSEAFELANGETRTFLEDGDRVIFRASCEKDGFRRIGFGACEGTILPARIA
jgi:fumarylacetoacetase